jgi:branched-chain amino acid transport system substrate-binding protein
VAYIYAGLPLNGPLAVEGKAIREGIYLARQSIQTHPGLLHIEFKVLNDSGRRTGAKNLALTAANAGKVATDPRAVYYIGDVGSAETAVSLPILNAAGIAQVTPGDPYISPRSGSTGLSSKLLLRLLPSYTVQAAADMLFFKQAKISVQPCTHVVAVAQQDDPESNALVNAMYTDATLDGIEMPKPTLLTSKSSLPTAFQHLSSLTCGFVIAGSRAKPAVAVAKLLHSMFPHAFIVGTSGLCTPNSKWTKAAVRGSSAIAASLLWCTSPILPVDRYAGADSFIKLYKREHHGSEPSAYAFYGYEAADLGIAMIDEYLGANGDNRVDFRTSLFESDVRDQVFLPYSLSTLGSYGLYSVDPSTAEPTFDTTIRP